jgi:predicted RecB family nuclease
MPTPSTRGTLRTCPNGHSYRKSSDCPVCPTCENERKPEAGFLAGLSAPARRALERARVTSLDVLSKHTTREILALHGMGPGSIPKLKQALEAAGMAFKD